jgi:single-strand DNA-binding protein
MMIVTGMGRLAGDPVVTEINGKKLAKFTLAVSRGGQKGEDGILPAWVDVEAWESVGEFVEKYFSKGSQMLVSGDLRQSTWETEGQKRSKLYIRANKIDFAGAKGSTSEESAETESTAREVVGAGKAAGGSSSKKSAEFDPFG